ncbi:MAG: type II toxin-antitoxin system RelE/ParE family toxin [Thermoguttaceae bacterium]|nr:type II toxin-antitoxin system RelE/ParE family toxin [Thermoguttaceae bacterium]MDW8039686.1 type II toxin-antitoxin system RelE/ParE family toxin [Thermoguttaceae bacterium]
MYEVYLERQAERDLRRLSRENFRRIVRRIKTLANNPRPSGSRKIVGSQSDWRIRVGDYRILYEVDDTSQCVRVMRVLHRREAYG